MYQIPTMHSFTPAFTLYAIWPARSQQLQRDYPHLTKEDLHFTPGKEHELLLRVGTRLKKSQEEVMHIIGNGYPDRF